MTPGWRLVATAPALLPFATRPSRLALVREGRRALGRNPIRSPSTSWVICVSGSEGRAGSHSGIQVETESYSCKHLNSILTLEDSCCSSED